MDLTYLSLALQILYFASAFFLVIYGYNCYIYLFIFLRNKTKYTKIHKSFIKSFYKNFDAQTFPIVTTQLPIFNEKYVACRLIDAVIKFDYPKKKHEIQILDDSTDDTWSLIHNHIKKYRKQGYRIKHIRRSDRVDYKAGALEAGLNKSAGKYVAIFDSDFVPPKHFLKHTIPYLMVDDGLGLVQTRWGHLNRNNSLLTRAQAMGIDGHFIIEQSARSWGNLFLNFNGTAGIWRKQAIVDAGGWHGDTLTEDMDLSYRSQLAGWKTRFVYDVVCKAELPENIIAFKSQQFRWAKGSIQTAKKLLPKILMSKNSLWKKLQSILHLTHYMIHPLMVTMALTSLPVILLFEFKFDFIIYAIFFTLIVGASLGPSTMYFFSQYKEYKDWKSKIVVIPFLITIGVGIAVNNTGAVFSALFGGKGAFIRTPKTGSTEKSKKQKMVGYKLGFSKTYLMEILLSLYCLASFFIYILKAKYLIGPFLFLYFLGFLASFLLSIKHRYQSI